MPARIPDAARYGPRRGGGGGPELREGSLCAVEVEGLALELQREVLPLAEELRLVGQQRRDLPVTVGPLGCVAWDARELHSYATHRPAGPGSPGTRPTRNSRQGTKSGGQIALTQVTLRSSTATVDY